MAVRRFDGTVVDLHGSWRGLVNSCQVLHSFDRSGAIILTFLASGFVVDHFGDLQIYDQNRGHNNKLMPILFKSTFGCFKGPLGQQSFPGSYKLFKSYIGAVLFDATWPIWGAFGATSKGQSAWYFSAVSVHS